MLTHVVLFDFDDDGAADEAVRRLQAMAPRIDVVEDLEVGRDVIGSDRSSDVGLIVRLADRDALEAYRVHPEHQPVVEFIRANATGSAAVDFES